MREVAGSTLSLDFITQSIYLLIDNHQALVWFGFGNEVALIC
jgi:hypothetical protein